MCDTIIQFSVTYIETRAGHLYKTSEQIFEKKCMCFSKEIFKKKTTFDNISKKHIVTQITIRFYQNIAHS